MMHPDALLPRFYSILLLVVSASMFVPLVFAGVAIAHGAAIPVIRWAVPLTILATGAALMGVLSRRVLSLNLFSVALALWILAAGYYWFGAILR